MTQSMFKQVTSNYINIVNVTLKTKKKYDLPFFATDDFMTMLKSFNSRGIHFA